MKIRAVWFVAAFVMTLLCHVSSAQAASLSDLLGFKPASDRTSSYNVANSGQSQYKEAVQYQAPAYPITPAKRTQSVDARKQGSPGPAYQRPIAQTQSNTRQVSSSRPPSKGKASQKTAAKNSLQSMTTLPPNQQANGRGAFAYQPIYPSQPRYASPQGYRQSQTGYYSNPYQSQYTPAGNYYQGYSYNTWGSSGQACPPGRT